MERIKVNGVGLVVENLSERELESIRGYLVEELVAAQNGLRKVIKELKGRKTDGDTEEIDTLAITQSLTHEEQMRFMVD